MESRVRVLGHPVHQMLVMFPLGMLAAAVGFDLIHRIQGDSVSALIAYRLTAGGLILGALAALFGFLDWLAVPRGTRARRVGLLHAVLNVVMLVGFGVSLLLRRGDPLQPSILAHLTAFAAFGVSAVAAWLGGELVNRLGIGVSPGANPDAPSSLSRTG